MVGPDLDASTSSEDWSDGQPAHVVLLRSMSPGTMALPFLTALSPALAGPHEDEAVPQWRSPNNAGLHERERHVP